MRDRRTPMSRSLFMPEMTTLEVREYIERGGGMVLVPVGSTEDHGDHAPLWTDVYIPLEIAKHAAPELDALVGAPVPFGLAPDHVGAPGVVSLRLETFVAVLEDVVRSHVDSGFTRIVLLNGHYVNTWAMAYAVSQFARELPDGVRAYPFPYWQGLQPEQAAAYMGPDVGIHANVGETSVVMAVDEKLVDMDRARDFTPDFGELRTNPFALLDPLFLSTPGSFWSLLEEGGGVWGSPSESTVEKGEEYISWCKDSVVNIVRDMEDVHDRIEPGIRANVPRLSDGARRPPAEGTRS
jgi:creatinine amidohydrolase